MVDGPSNTGFEGGSSRGRRPAWIAALLLTLAVGVGGFVHFHNELVTLDVQIDTQWTQVENQLRRQADLIPNLVKVTRAYTDHEKEIFAKVAAARSRLIQGTRGDQQRAADEVGRLLPQLVVLAEAYPNLKADRRHQDLSLELSGTQNRIAVERRRYNELVGVLNSRLRMIPWSLVSRGIEERDFLEVPKEQLRTPQVEL